MNIYLSVLHEQDDKALFEFECRNRSYFEEFVPSRGEEYYQYSLFQLKHQELLQEQKKRVSIFFLIKEEETGMIVGRLNVVDIDTKNQSGELGYRVGQEFTGKGIASKALHLLLQDADQYELREIHAKTTSGNSASQRILEKCGFTLTSIENNGVELNGKTMNFLHYKWRSYLP